MSLEELFEQRLHQNLFAYQDLVKKILKRAEKDIAVRIAKCKLRYPGTFSDNAFYKINKQIEREIDSILKVMAGNIEKTITEGISKSWDLANAKNDLMTGEYISGLIISESIKKSFFQLNTQALSAFIGRSVDGLNLSDKIWKLTKIKKYAIEKYLASGIATGQSAASISIDIRRFEINPKLLFRRVRDEEGMLRLSKAAKAYTPGQGIYRSSYKNALRLTATETNIANRTADFIRRKQLPFVTGVEIHLSPAHPRPDICDSMTGKYPKGFLFTGWHPLCMCYPTSIMLSKKEFANYLNSGKINTQRYVRTIPKKAQNYLSSHKKTIAGWKNKPYFIKDNFKSDFSLKNNVLKV